MADKREKMRASRSSQFSNIISIHSLEPAALKRILNDQTHSAGLPVTKNILYKPWTLQNCTHFYLGKEMSLF
jgi:hypothetical protein